MTQNEKNARIASLNDEFRRRRTGGHFQISPRIRARGDLFVTTAMFAVQADDQVAEDVPQNGRRDFGVVLVDGVPVCWRIDYEDKHHPYAPANPLSTANTERVLSMFTPVEQG